MINYLEGEIIERDESDCLIINNGIGYKINCYIKECEFVKLFIVSIFNEGYTFYGFEKIEEKELFEKLIKIKGIGPKIAFKVVSNSKGEELRFEKIITIKGISSKKAEEIVGAINGKKNSLKIFKELKELGFDEAYISEKLSKIDLSKKDDEIVKEFLK